MIQIQDDESSPHFSLLAYRIDPFARLLVDHLRLSPAVLGLALFIISIVLHLGLAGYSGYLFTNGTITGSLNNWGFRIVDFFAVPAFGVYYLWTALAPDKLFTEIRNSRITHVSVEDWQALRQVYSSRFWLPSAVVVTLALNAILTVSDVREWWTTSLIYFVVALIWYIVCTYIVCMLCIRTIATTINLLRLFRFKILYLQLFNPDKAGGLGALGRYALTITYVVAISGLGVVGWEYSTLFKGLIFELGGLIAHITLLAYVIVAPISFFAPLLSAHAAMQEAKRQVLLELAGRIQKNLEDSRHDLSAIPNVEQLDRLYHLLEGRIPTWPFDISTLRKVVFAILSPFGAMIPIVVDLLLKSLLPKS
jgi:hypothetical protein